MRKQFVLVNKRGSEDIYVCIDRVYNVGYAGRDRAVVRAHVDELAAMGVDGPKHIPAIYPVANSLICSDHLIQVQHDVTSGEVEFSLMMSDGKQYVTIGSDHSDRDLEKTSVPWAKQVYPNVVAREVWDYDEVKDHWDDIMMRCWVWKDGVRTLYQEGKVAEILSPEELIAEVKAIAGDDLESCTIFSGTLPTIGGMICGDRYDMELEDPKLGRKLATQYRVERLADPLE